MWRDLNIYNEMGIPAVTFGPTRYTDEVITPKYRIKYLVTEDLVKTARTVFNGRIENICFSVCDSHFCPPDRAFHLLEAVRVFPSRSTCIVY